MRSALTIDDPRYFDRLASADLRHWWHSGMWRIAESWLDRAIPGRRVLLALDVGCGSGGTLARLRSRPEVDRAIGIDPSLAAIRRANDPDAIPGSALALPFAPGSIDLLTCFDVLQHLPIGGDASALREVSRVLRPGGIMILRSNGRGLRPPRGASPPPYRLGSLVGLVRDSGLRVIAATYANALPSIGAEMLGWLRRDGRYGHPSGRGLRIAQHEGDRGGPPSSRGRAADRLMRIIASTEADLIGKWGARLPVGHSTMILATKDGEARG